MPLRWFQRRSPEIDDQLWGWALAQFRFIGHLNDAQISQLRKLCEAFVRTKTISGAHGFEITNQVRITIAFQACLPVLRLGLASYDDFVEIIVYPAQFRVPRRVEDDAGVVHESVEDLAGEAMDRGPVILSWPDVQAQDMNLTIHEFVHKLDLADGIADGIPMLTGARRSRWHDRLHSAYDAFCAALELIELEIPPDVDPESARADRWYRQLPL
ncbi:MAG: zinc-dependent peptidase, partial [Quisquiliibacterium sp.]